LSQFSGATKFPDIKAYFTVNNDHFYHIFITALLKIVLTLPFFYLKGNTVNVRI